MSDDPRMILLQAIATRHMVAADYNGARLTLAPHLMFERRGALFISAYNPAKSIRSDEEPRLGHFKLEGLRAVELLDDAFDPLPDFAPTPPRADDTLILAV